MHARAPKCHYSARESLRDRSDLGEKRLTGDEESVRLHTCAHPRRCPGENDVTRKQLDRLRKSAHELSNRKDQLCC